MAKKWRENLNLNGNRGAGDISFRTKSRDVKKKKERSFSYRTDYYFSNRKILWKKKLVLVF